MNSDSFFKLNANKATFVTLEKLLGYKRLVNKITWTNPKIIACPQKEESDTY